MRARTLLIASTLSLVGCFSSLADRDDNIACVTSANCPAGYWCQLITKQCVKGDFAESPFLCVTDTDCPFKFSCVDSECQQGCFEDGDCGLREACIDGACAEVALSCNDDTLCPFGFRCDPVGKRCEQHPDASYLCAACAKRVCLDSSDCPGTCNRPDPNQVGFCNECGNGECRYTGSGTVCGADSDCATGEYCDEPPCFQDSDCAFGGRNYGECTFRSYNPDGQFASPMLKGCQLGRCVRPFCVKPNCTDNADCPKGYQCFRQIAASMQGCQTDAECPGERVCRVVNEEDQTRFCSCLTDQDCAAGQTCDNGSCLIGRNCLPALGLTCEEVRSALDG